MSRHHRIMFFSLLLGGSLTAATGAALASLGAFTAGAVLCLLGCFYGEIHFRCPHCGDYMGVGRYQPGHSCRRCGHTLEKSRELRARRGDRLTAAGDALRP